MAISDKLRKKVTLSKRKRGLFKKAIELSILCEIDIFMCIFDSDKQKVFELNTNPDFDIRVVNHILDKVNKLQFKCLQFSNADYDNFNKPDVREESDEEGGK